MREAMSDKLDALREALIAQAKLCKDESQRSTMAAYWDGRHDAFIDAITIAQALAASAEPRRRNGDEGICPNCNKPLIEHGFACLEGEASYDRESQRGICDGTVREGEQVLKTRREASMAVSPIVSSSEDKGPSKEK